MSGDEARLATVSFPSGAPHDACATAVLAVRDYIHEQGGATKADVVTALSPAEEYPLGHNGVAARAKGLVPNFEEWWWGVVLQGLRELPDVEAVDDQETTWRPVE